MTDTVPVVDGIRPGDPGLTTDTAARSRARRTLLLLLLGPYALYLLWCFFLMSVLPSASGSFDPLIPVGLLSAAFGAGVLLLIGAIAFQRIMKSMASPRRKKMAIFVTTVFALPGLALSAAMPLLITRDPQLSIVVTKPVGREAFVAPVAVTLSLADATQILARKNLRAVSYQWDFDGDGQQNAETVVPEATALYDQPGNYVIAAKIQLQDGSFRRAALRLLIPSAVFSVDPIEPVVNEPVTFSVLHLVDDPENILEVRWDLDGDGTYEDAQSGPTTTRTFSRTGDHTVAVQVLLQNQSQTTYERQVTVGEAPVQPFAVRILSEPNILISPPPFGVIFTLQTQENLSDVEWNFGDATPITRTTDQHRVGHTFEGKGTYRVTATAHATNGDSAVASAVVQLVDPLRLTDLLFDGTPAVAGNRLTGQAPLSVNLRAVTSTPLVSFSWEAPEATSVGSTDTNLQALYRKPGTYKITLFARDAGGKAMRQTLTVEVTPPDSVVHFTMDPQTGLAPLTVRFDASETSIPGETISGFEWTFGDETTGIETSQGIAIEEHTFDKPNRYPVKLTVVTVSGKTYETTSTIVVLPPKLDARFIPSRTSGQLKNGVLGVSFDRSPSIGSIASVQWDFGDGSQSDDPSPTVIHVYEQAGTFEVRLKITDSAGLESSTSRTITIAP